MSFFSALYSWLVLYNASFRNTRFLCLFNRILTKQKIGQNTNNIL
ncbi:hypothetical protein HMPREF9554_00941 [Treponema phagedenis F0421]|nr:hypothetical protein HMPREF9554_00941 [Treponema phagedenis F0421]